MKKILLNTHRLFSNKTSLVFAVLLLAAILRFWRLGSIPPSLTQDEAALGYNAYSILMTGKDEYGKLLPIIFKSFGDYKPGLYIYLDVPFVFAMGLNEFAVRLPSAISGVLSVYLIYLICRELFIKKSHKFAVITAFVAAINPWLIYLSRGAWEANVCLLLTLSGIYFFLKAFERNRYFILSACFFGLTLLTYQGAKLSSSIVVLILLIIFGKQIFKFDKRCLYGGAFLGILLSLPIVFTMLNGQAGRLRVASIFSYPRSAEYIQTFLDQGNEKIGSPAYLAFHSETLNFARGIMGRYFNHFSAKFLFFEGDYQNPGHSAPYQGMFLLGDIIFLVVGIFALIRDSKLFNKQNIFILLWLVLSPFPAILSRDQVQSVRAVNLAIPLIFAVSSGLDYLLGKIKSFKWSLPGYLILAVIFSAGFLYFADAYYIHVPKHNSNYWNYGYKEVVFTVSTADFRQKNIVVEQSYSQPYIYFLFYQKYDPYKYQQMARLDESKSGDVGLVEQIDNVYFKYLDWPQDKRERNVVVVADDIQAPIDDIEKCANCKVLREIKYLDGREIAYRVIEIK
jgi:4-amino-4-deoxy-L-arabinose transferase-like glycosyltransferase